MKTLLDKHPWMVVIASFHLFILTQIQFIPWPELHLWPYLIDHGYQVYKDIAFEKFPGLLFILVPWFRLFGNSLFSLQLLTWIIILITDFILYFTAFNLSKSRFKSALILIINTLLMSAFEGNGLWFDLVLAPLFLLLFHFSQYRKMYPLGILFTIAVLVKQNAIISLIPLWFTFKSNSNPKNLSFIKGLLSLAIPLLLIALSQNLLPSIFKWSVEFLPLLNSMSFQKPTPVQLLVIVSILIVFISNFRSQRLISIWGITCLFFLYPRSEYFHLQPVIPFLALTLAFQKKFMPLNNFLLVLLSTFAIYRISNLVFLPDRFYEPSTIALSGWIKSKTHPGDQIYLVNTWDHLYVLSETLPAIKPWSPSISWYMAYDEVEENFITGLESSKPGIVVSENLSQPHLQKIYGYLLSNYLTMGVLDNRFTIWQRI